MNPRFGPAMMEKERARLALAKIMQEQGDAERRKGASVRILLCLIVVFLCYYVVAGRSPPPAIPAPKVSDLVDAAKSIESLLKNTNAEQARLAMGEKPLGPKAKRDLASVPDSKRKNYQDKLPPRLQAALNQNPPKPKPGYGPASPKRLKILSKNEGPKTKKPYGRPNKKQATKTAQKLPSSVKGHKDEKYIRVAGLPARLRWNLSSH